MSENEIEPVEGSEETDSPQTPEPLPKRSELKKAAAERAEAERKAEAEKIAREEKSKPKSKAKKKKKSSGFSTGKKIAFAATAVLIPIAAAVGLFASGGLRDVPAAPKEIFSRADIADVCKPFADFNCKADLKPSDTVPAGKLISMGAQSGFAILPVNDIRLTYSAGPKNPELPDLHKLSQTDAEVKLFEAGLTLGEISEVDDRAVAPGRVVEAKPVDPKLVNGSKVDLHVASASIEVPNWVGQPRAQIEVEAEKLGVEVKFEFAENPGAPDIALSQKPAAGERTKSSQLIVVLSKPEKIVEIKIPDVVGMDATKAQSALATAGFTKITIVEVESTKVKTKQVSQVVPAAGQSAKNDANIVVIVANPIAKP